MPKTKISEFSTTPGNNTDINGINIAEGCAPSGINNAIRELMSDLKEWQSGAMDVYIVPQGTVAAPAVQLYGDLDTGLYGYAANQLGVAVGGTSAGYFSSAGWVGNVNGTITGDINATTIDTTNLEVTNVKAKDGTASFSIANSTGAVSVSTLLNVDNIRIDGNTISATNTNGSVNISGSGTGQVVVYNADVQSGQMNSTTIGATTPSSGAFTTLSASSTATLNTLSSSGATLTGGTINGMAIGGVTPAAGAFTTISASGNATLSGGTANAMLYLNASKVVTSGSAFQFDGTNLTVGAGVTSMFYGPLVVVGNTTLDTVDAGVINTTTTQVTNIKAKDGTASIVLTNTTGAVDFSKAVTMSATTQNIALGTSQTSGTFTVGGASQTGTQTFDQSTKTHTLNVGAGATESAATKTINIGTAGVSGSTTAINIGSTNGTTVTLNGTVNATTVNVTTLDLTNIEVTNIKAKDGTASITLADSTGVASFSANPILSGGTANGVTYLNGSKVLTSGSALTFDGTNFATTGTASATKLIPTGGAATGNGMYLPAANSISITTNGTNAIYIDSSQNVGIGTTSPGARLEVLQSQNGATRVRVNNQNSGASAVAGIDLQAYGGGWTIDVPQSSTFVNPLQFIFGGSEKMRLDASGNLGLGVTPSAWGSGYKSLDIGNTASFLNSSGSAFVANNAYQDGSGWKYKTSTASIGTQLFGANPNGNGGYAWFQAASGTAGNAITFTQAMTLDASGNLGIGTTSPGYKLDVVGRSALKSTNDAFSLALGYGSSASNFIYLGASANTNPDLVINNGAVSEIMRLTNSGNLGLGVTPVPYGAGNRVFQIYDGSAAAEIRLTNNTTGSSAANGGLLQMTGNDFYIWNVENSFLSFGTNNTERVRITSVGNLKLGGTADRATTVGTNHLDIFNGTAPVGTLTNGISLYSSSGEAYVMDAAGNATLFSPHDAETNEWIFKSKHTPTGKVLKIDVEKMLRFINDHFGLDAIHEFTE